MTRSRRRPTGPRLNSLLSWFSRQFAAALQTWIDQVARLADASEYTKNSITASARAAGYVVQAWAITGPVTFH
jgi:hypothetical protein